MQNVPSAARWLLSWLPESHESESLEEWSRSNMYLIPSARLPSAKQRNAAAAAEQRYATKWPPPRPGRAGHGLVSGSPASPYGRFGKSFPPMLEAPLERREEEEESEQQDEVAHRGLKRAHSSSGVATDQPKRRSLEQQQQQHQQPEGAQTEQQQWRQPKQHVQNNGSSSGIRRSTDPGGNIRRPTQPIAIRGASSRPPTPVPTHGMLRHDATGVVQRRSSSSTTQGAADTDPAVLSQLLDDTVQLLGHTSLIARQESAPAIMVRHSCTATVNALNASLSSNSLAAQAAAAAACMDSDASPRTPDQCSPMHQGLQHGGPFVLPPTAPAQL